MLFILLASEKYSGLKHFFLLLFLFVLTGCAAVAQLSNKQSRTIVFTTDTVLLDTLSFIPGSVSIVHNSIPLDSTCYKLLFAEAKVIFKKSCDIKFGDSLLITYRTFPLLFSNSLKNRDRSILKQKYAGQYNPFKYDEGESGSNAIFSFDGLNKSGSISRGISFGNNQDVIVNSGLNLQLSGTLSDKVEILAAITDNNVPIQPEGNTQQLQEFDKVFVQLSRDSTKLIAGDFELNRPASYFMNFFKKAQGALFSTAFTLDDKNKWLMHTAEAAAISKGKFARNTIAGIEANQGPYRLTGSEGEQFIIVLSGTEKIYLNGRLLVRGKENDYVIDYNTAQLTFSARRLITKDSRIVAEFQYSDKNYVRTLLYSANTIENNNLKLRFNYITEQDNKNQPLFQDLDADKKNVLANAGDNLNQALFPKVDSVAFSVDEVLYKRDTTVVDGVTYIHYTYSTDSTVAHFRLGFSQVGLGRGNYTLTNSNANGKVYQWLAPVGGLPQGEYEPVSLLASPKRQQMLTVGGEYAFSKNTSVMIEGVYSKNDINLFSKKDKSNDVGYGLTAGIMNALPLHWKDSAWKVVSVLGMEYTDQNFKPIENYRAVEFTRDWNLTNIRDTASETLLSAKTGLVKSDKENINYYFKSFLRGVSYTGLLNGFNGNYSHKGFNLNYNGNLLTTSGTLSKTRYLRSYADLARVFKRFNVGYKQENERNRIYVPGTDSLTLSSTGHDQGSVYITSRDTGKFTYKSEILRRYDEGITNNSYGVSTIADQASADIAYAPNYNARLSLGSTYRQLDINNENLTGQKKDESFINRLEMNFTLLRGGITTNTYYEIGTGQEPKLAYSFLKVAAGTGVYEWNDYNGNGIQELNEFEVANYSDKAEYIKVFTPTNDFIKTQSNQLSEVLAINPAAFIKNKDGKTKFINRFALQFAARFDNKLLDGDILKEANPFKNNVSDTTLVTTNSSYRNTLFFNRSSSVFASDLTYEDNRNKSLLANGAESRFQRSLQLITRTNVKRIYGLNMGLRAGSKENISAFINRNYTIVYQELEPRLSIQPGTVFRTTFYYKLQSKDNTYSDSNEHTEINTLGTEIKYSSIKNGVVSANVNIISIGYNANENTPLAFEMLEGLKRGKNITWELNVQRNLSGSLQLNLGYNGRKPQGEKTIHTANVQVRAVF